MKNAFVTADLIKLQDILDAIDDVRNYRADDLAVKKNMHAAAFCFTIIGEASRQVSATFKKDHPELPWRDMQDTRNRIVHEYDGVDPKKMMQIIDDDLPHLHDLIHKMLDTYLQKLPRP